MTELCARTRLLPLAEALLVTFLWSTSYILIKVGLEEINPYAFAAYRYTLASTALIVPTLYRHKEKLAGISFKRATGFLALGFTGYFVAQGLQFLGLYYLRPMMVTFILNLSPVFVLAFSAVFLDEKPSQKQMVGIILTLCGVFVFFFNSLQSPDEVIGVFITLISGVGWAAYMILTRHYLSQNRENVIVLTFCSMAFGALMLLGTTVVTGNIVVVSLEGWIIIAWLSIVNTLIAFALWNHALKILKAYEQSILQNTMLVQITLLSVVFLDEQLTLQKLLGMALVFIGVLIVQLKGRLLKQSS